MAPIRTLSLVTVTAVAIAACGSKKDDQTTPGSTASAKRGGTLTVPWSADVDSIDPGQTYYSGGYMVANVTQRTPIAYEPGSSKPRPDLAVAAPGGVPGWPHGHGQAALRRALLAARPPRGGVR